MSKSRLAQTVCVVPLLVVVAACSKGTPASPLTPTAPTTPTPAASPQVVLNAPTPVAPLNNASVSGWPTFTVTDSTRSGTATATSVVYRFDIAASQTFDTVLLTGTVSEAQNQTSYTPPPGTPPPPQNGLFWRAIAIDPIHVVASPPSVPEGFTYVSAPSQAAVLAAQEGAVLWPGAQPPGFPGHAIMGNGWGVGTPTSFNGVTFVSPQIDQLQVFDLIDRGLDPQAAIDWMHSNGYSTVAAYYPAVAVIGFPYSYLALIDGQWSVVLKVGA